MYVPESEQCYEEFYTDLVNSAIFDTPVAYLQKYEQIENYASIVNSQQTILKLCYHLVAKNIQKTSNIVQYLTENNIDERATPFLAKIISNKIGDIRNTLIRKQIARGSPCLLDNNWRIINVQMTSWNARTNRVLLALTLIVQEQNQIGKQIQQINMELNIYEAESLLNKLKEIKKFLKI